MWDNNDFAEETLSGEGTTHNTNGILVQRITSTESQHRGTTQKFTKTKKRSVDCPPRNIELYRGGMRNGPATVSADIMKPSDSILQKQYHTLDLAFCLAKLPGVNGRLLPGWTGFNTLVDYQNIPPMSKVGYLPVIDASPTDMSTVNTILLRSVDIADSLELDSIAVVFDQAIYAKAQQIRWQNACFSKRLVIRLGEFHTIMSYLAVIGKRFMDSGLQDILIEAEVIAAGSINAVLTGHHYNRSMRAHKLLFEAMQRLRWKQFLQVLSTNEQEEATEVVSKLREVGPTSEFNVFANDDHLHSVLDKYENFISKSRAVNPTFDLWSSYLDMIATLLQFVRATRQGLWELHTSVLQSMLPWYFAYDHVNYARYLPVYIAEMANLSESHPSVHASFLKGDFVAQRQTNYGFGQIACDQLIEQTLNRDSKTKGGLTGITLSSSAVSRWVLSHHERASIAKACKTMAGKDDSGLKKNDLLTTRMRNDEERILALESTIASMVDPFAYEGNDLLNIASGVVAQDDVRCDLVKAWETGKAASEKFYAERLTDGGTVDLFAPIRANKLKTFSSGTGKKSVTKLKSETVTLKASGDLFRRLLLIGQTRKIDLKLLLSHALTTIPACLGTYDGMNVKTDKAKLMHELEEAVSDADTEIISCHTGDAALIVDGMAMLQTVNTAAATFGSFATKMLENLLNIGRHYKCNRIDFVTDRYPRVSIKNCERGRRASFGVQVIRINRPDQKLPKQFKKYPSSGENKEELVEFLFTAWRDCDAGLLRGIDLYVCHGEMCHRVQVEQDAVVVTPVAELQSDHEEADTRLLLHAKHASPSHSNVIIKSPGTDVMVLSVAFAIDLGINLFLITGSGNFARIINVSKIASVYGHSVCQSILGFHVFTGCDSVSAFKGKIKGLQLMLDSCDMTEAFHGLGVEWDLSDDTFVILEKFVCHLYGQKNCMDVNEARYNMFRLKF